MNGKNQNGIGKGGREACREEGSDSPKLREGEEEEGEAVWGPTVVMNTVLTGPRMMTV